MLCPKQHKVKIGNAAPRLYEDPPGRVATTPKEANLYASKRKVTVTTAMARIRNKIPKEDTGTVSTETMAVPRNHADIVREPIMNPRIARLVTNVAVSVTSNVSAEVKLPKI